MRKYGSILILFATLVLVSCNVEPIENYKGSVVYYKCKINSDVYKLEIKSLSDSLATTHKYSFKKIYIMELDANRYNVGDTIK